MAGRRPARARLDAELVRRGLVPTRAEAQRLIAAGRVTVAGSPAGKPAAMVAPDDALVVVDPGPGWASRGAHKLEGALDTLGVAVAGRDCLDAGASTGGFTDVLLLARRRGPCAGGRRRLRAAGLAAAHRRAGRRPRAHQRPPPRPRRPAPAAAGPGRRRPVVHLPAAGPPRAARAVADPAADHVLLVKPQFEAGPERVGRGGVVRDPAVWRDALDGVVGAARDLGLALAGACASPLPGPAGNVEFFVHLAEGRPDAGGPALDAAVAAGLALRPASG